MGTRRTHPIPLPHMGRLPLNRAQTAKTPQTQKGVCLRRPVTDHHRQTPRNTTPACEDGRKRRETCHPAFNKPLPQPSRRVTHTFASARQLPSVQHKRVERTRSKRHLDTAIGIARIGKFKRTLLFESVLGHHHNGAIRTTERNSHRIEMTRSAKHMRTRLNEMREMTHHIIFRITANLMRIRSNGEQ